MAIPMNFVLRTAIPLIVSTLLFSENHGPDLVKLYDQIQRTSDIALHNARGEGTGATENFDYIVVGGGSAGAVVANRLSASGKHTVLLLEAGGDPNPVSDIPLGRRHVFTDAELSVAYFSEPQANACRSRGGRCYHARAKTLGGSSVLNGCLYNRCQTKDYDSWANFTGDPFWRYANVVQSFKRIENYNGFYKDAPTNRGVKGEVFVGKMDYIPGSDIVLEALAEQGIPNGDYNSGTFPFGYSKVDYNIKDGLRQSSYHAFLQPILDRPNLKIYRYAWASKVHFDDTKRATGVTYQRHGESRFVTANKEVIVSGGVFESPKLLMLSGIGPASHLAAHGITTVVDLPTVGDYLQDHIAIGMRSHAFSVNQTFGKVNWFNNESLTEYLEKGTGPLNSFEFGTAFAPQLAMGYTASPSYNDRTWPDIQTYIHEELIHSNGIPQDEHIYVDHALMRPKSYGTVRLASTDIEELPLIDPKFFNDPKDLERLIDGVEYTANIFLTAPKLKAIGIKWADNIKMDPKCTEHKFPSRDYWRCFVIQQSSTHFHPTSSCRMGPNNTVAVVDSHLRVFGTKGLRVIDASVMPFVPSGNTNFPSMMIGDLGAQRILNNV